MLKIPFLRIDVALTAIGCAGKDCVRVLLPAEIMVMRGVEGTAVAEPLCPVCAAAALEDAKLSARLFLHREEQRVAMERMALEAEESSPETEPFPAHRI